VHKPKSVAKVRHLENNWRVIKVVEEAGPVRDILVRAGDDALVRADITGQHRDRVVRDRHHPTDQAGFGRLRKIRVAVGHVDQRVAPHIGRTSNRLDVGRGHGGAARRAGNLGGGCGNGDLLRQSPTREHQEGRPGAE